MPKDTWKVNIFLLMEDMNVKFVTVNLKRGRPGLVTILNITAINKDYEKLVL